MNTIALTGRLTADPEHRITPSGTSVCNLRLAVDRMARNEETGYIDVACFGKSADAAAKILTKGWKVAVEGRLDYQTWEAQDGTNRSKIAVIGHVEFLTAPRGNANTEQADNDTEREETPAL